VKRYGINQKTVAKWKKRTSVADVPTGPKSLSSTILTIEEEAVIVAFRKHTLLPLDDCLYALQPTIPKLTRSSLHRCLQRHGCKSAPKADHSLRRQQCFEDNQKNTLRGGVSIGADRDPCDQSNSFRRSERSERFRWGSRTAPVHNLEAARALGVATEGLNKPPGDLLADRVISVMRAIGAPVGLSGAGYTIDDLDALTDKGWQQRRVLGKAPPRGYEGGDANNVRGRPQLLVGPTTRVANASFVESILR
jgi:hypothetical protein